MKKSELKEFIKSSLLREDEDSKKGNKEEQERMEGAIRDDRDHIKDLEKDIKDNEDKLSKLKDDFKEDVDEGMRGSTYEEDDIKAEGLLDFLKKKKEAAPAKAEDSNPIIGVDYDGNYIRKDGTMAEGMRGEDDVEEGMRGKYEEDDTMREAEEVDVEDNEDINVDVEDEVNIDDESDKSEIEVDSELSGEDSETAAILGLLTKAQEKAKGMGDDKLLDQIGNTITYYTRAHVVATNEMELDVTGGEDDVAGVLDAESSLNLQEIKRFKKLAGLIK